ncbi:hypothetical protein I7I53_07436 [Histoplasma capsulatum var. duboisii H88]|uniref:Uncharacterized protein n=1 Tax=Ajellomyces capsulatus (strain H88) TaxID=544711 RepID=A0A8A1LD23_AJEC8|nr:hypothetical protein I7I53_07436 [Histoplasma capsulatum var. duboisii H88]
MPLGPGTHEWCSSTSHHLLSTHSSLLILCLSQVYCVLPISKRQNVFDLCCSATMITVSTDESSRFCSHMCPSMCMTTAVSARNQSGCILYLAVSRVVLLGSGHSGQ